MKQLVTCLALVAAVSVVSAQRSWAAEPAATALQLRSLAVTDMDGNRHEPFSDESTKAICLIFVSTDCPIANSFQPSLKEIHQAYNEKGIACFMVHCSTMTDEEAIRKHIADFEIDMAVVPDFDQTIGRMVAAKNTPEAIVIDREGVIRYRGLINNLYEGYGERRPAPTEHYLTDAFDALINGQAVAVESTKPFGCLIYYPRSRRS